MPRFFAIGGNGLPARTSKCRALQLRRVFLCFVRIAVAEPRPNVDQFPQEWNVYNSLGEAYLKLGNKPEAITNYKRSLELNPNNDNGRGVLKSLGVL